MGNPDVPLPRDMARLPLDHAGRPIPWFVAELPDGTRDPRIADQAKRRLAERDRLCWVCGNPRGSYRAFLIGPMCAVNRISSEPPSHRACAVYSARACPFLSTPQMVRRERGKITPAQGRLDPAGVMITRNPGVSLVWVTRSHQVWGRPDGLLWRIGDPTAVECYTRGRIATRAEVLAAMESGLPLLQDATRSDPNPEASLAILERQYTAALNLLPTDPTPFVNGHNDGQVTSPTAATGPGRRR